MTEMTLLKYLKPTDRLLDPKGPLSFFILYRQLLNKFLHTPLVLETFSMHKYLFST